MSIDELLSAYHGFDPSAAAPRHETQATALARHTRPADDLSADLDHELAELMTSSRRFSLRRSH